MKQSKAIIVTGLLLILSYIFKNDLVKELWILGEILIALLGVVFAIVLGFSIIKWNKKSILFGLGILLSLVIIDSQTWEVFKSKKVLQARLIDDLSGMTLVLRENKEFELQTNNIFGKESFNGTYEIEGNKLIFINRPYWNSFIHDTVTIIDNNIILDFDANGTPNMEFANYFEIEINELF
ncbi:hypothetical protein [Labilibacter marinus]|uniref:hypothetical protein n=1 Tax=Labilibacter marinus TaxID=1477105 RepID=UPI00094F7E3C|nr:hypothetical protein [Labilibacter marinus]